MRLPLLVVFTLFPLTLLSQSRWIDGSYLKSSNSQGVNISGGWTVWRWFDDRLQVQTGARLSLWSGESVKAEGVADEDIHLNGAATVGSVNLLLGLEGQLTQSLSAGFNIDLVGASLGKWKPKNTTDKATVTPLNLLLGGKPDFGTLNSEFWLGWNVNDQWMVRGGLNHHFTEVRTRETLAQADRFRLIENPVFLAIRWKW